MDAIKFHERVIKIQKVVTVLLVVSLITVIISYVVKWNDRNHIKEHHGTVIVNVANGSSK